MAIGVALLGSTGSIGKSALAVLARHPDRFRVVALVANRNAGELARQIEEWSPEVAVLVDESNGDDLPNRIGPTNVRRGRPALLDAARHASADIVINAVVGAAGLEATLAALEEGRRLALANKESLVAGGPLVLEALKRSGGELVPIDSEHSAILQCLEAVAPADIQRIILTASGGPFRNSSLADIAGATLEQALRHPTWDMGAKITIDSASLANKALEVIEAHFLFGIEYGAIDVVVHPQSIIHSMVELIDGSVIAQMGFPSMELPILYALTHPSRVADTGTRRFDPVGAASLTFEPVDPVRFPAFGLGFEAGRIGGTAPAVFNAANEVAVAGFLEGRLPFGRLASVIEAALARHRPVPVDTLETVVEADREARVTAVEAMGKIAC